MASAAPRVAVVVGGTAGLGRACALRLAEANFRVFVVGRDAERGAAVVADCVARGGADRGHEFVACDASRIGAVRTCAASISSRVTNVDALVLTQGIASMAGRTETPEGLDVKLSLHYFSRVAFIQALLPSLRAAPAGGRVLSVLSAGVHGVYAHAVDHFELKTHFSIKNAADAAGLYNDLALDSLAQERDNANVAFVHAAPGFVATSWGTELPWAARCLVRGLQTFAKPADEAGDVLVRSLLAAPLGKLSLVDPKGGAAPRTRDHDALREGVWKRTLELLGRIK